MQVPDFPPTVPELLRACTARAADAPLIVHGTRRLSYGEVDRESAALARGLLARGIGKGTRVALWMPNGPDWLIAFFAAARIGALVTPINTFYRAREAGWALRHSDAECLLCYARFLNNDYLSMLEETMPGLASQNAEKGEPLRVPSHPYLREIHAWGEVNRSWCRSGPESLLRAGAATGQGGAALDGKLLASVETTVSPADALAVIYTSGSTGEPKGAIHSHGAMVRHACNLNQFRDLDASARLYSPMPFFWVGGLVFTLFSAMHAGACLLTEDVFEAGATLDFLERERATHVAGWPHYAKAMLEHPTFPCLLYTSPSPRD